MAKFRNGYTVMSYRNGEVEECFTSISEAAENYHIGVEMIKLLIATGATLPTDSQVTFDIPADEPVNIVLDENNKPIVVKDVSFLVKKSLILGEDN